MSCASAPFTASSARNPVTPRIDEAPGITTSATVPGVVSTWIGRKAPEVFGISTVSAQRTAWYTHASMNERVLFSEPRTIGAQSVRSAVISSPSIVTVAVIRTSARSIPSESR